MIINSLQCHSRSPLICIYNAKVNSFSSFLHQIYTEERDELMGAAIMGTQRLRADSPEWECSGSQRCPSKALAQEAFWGDIARLGGDTKPNSCGFCLQHQNVSRPYITTGCWGHDGCVPRTQTWLPILWPGSTREGLWQELGEGLLFPLIDLFGFNFFMLSSVHLGVVYFVLKAVLEIPVLWVGQLSC